jgi:hypothetical protein
LACGCDSPIKAWLPAQKKPPSLEHPYPEADPAGEGHDYLLQCIGAWIAAGGIEERRRRLLLRGGFSILAVILALVVIFAIPAEGA